MFISSGIMFCFDSKGRRSRVNLLSAHKNPPALHTLEVLSRGFKTGETTVTKCG